MGFWGVVLIIQMTLMQWIIPCDCINNIDESVWDCDFDSGSWCEFYDSGPILGWRILSGSTPTSITGPTSDYSGSGYYLYAEANLDVYYAGYFSLQLDFGRAFTGSAVSFQYSMYGSGIGDFYLNTSTDGVTYNTVWSKSGNQGTTWWLGTADISNNPVSIRFVS